MLQAKVLKYHVLGQKLFSKDVKSGAVDTLDAGSMLTVTADSSGVSLRDGGVNTARVTQADVLASNGVVHVIDAVLVPAALVETVRQMIDPAPKYTRSPAFPQAPVTAAPLKNSDANTQNAPATLTPVTTKVPVARTMAPAVRTVAPTPAPESPVKSTVQAGSLRQPTPPVAASASVPGVDILAAVVLLSATTLLTCS